MQIGVFYFPVDYGINITELAVALEEPVEEGPPVGIGQGPEDCLVAHRSGSYVTVRSHVKGRSASHAVRNPATNEAAGHPKCPRVESATTRPPTRYCPGITIGGSPVPPGVVSCGAFSAATPATLGDAIEVPAAHE